MAPTKRDDGEPALKRLGGGRWQTRDERFTIEPQSGTWVVVDAEQTDDLGLALVRGPFRSLTEAKAGIEAARGAEAPASPLAARLTDRPTAAAAATPKPRAGRRAKEAPPEPPPPPPEPRWIAELAPADRRRARRAIERFETAGIRDAEGIARRDLVGDVAAIAATLVAERIAGLVAGAASGPEAEPADKLAPKLAAVLVDGHDPELDVRWRLVDDHGRPIHLSIADIGTAIDRRRKAQR